MLTILCLYARGFPLLLAVDLAVPTTDPKRWTWGIAGHYVRARAGSA